MRKDLQWDLGIGKRSSEAYKRITDKLIALKSHRINECEMGRMFLELWACNEKKICFIVVDHLLDGADVYAPVTPDNNIQKTIEAIDKI